MHSRIFQVSNKPIDKDDYAIPEHFYDCHSDWADYIGETQDDNDRKSDIKALSCLLRDMFDLDESGEALVYKGGIDAFKEEWAAAIREAAKAVTADNVLDWHQHYDVCHACKDTHLNVSYRFSIEGWSTYANAIDELIRFIAYKLKEGDKLYFGSVIDYHY